MTAKRGEAYVNSPERRRFDILAASALVPVEMAFRVLAMTQHPLGHNPILRQKRMGPNGRIIDVRKMQTLNEDGAPISALMELFRMNGIDELPQIGNILAGDMSITGRRPLIPKEFERQYAIVGADREGAKLVDYHRRTAGIAKPGILSTHALQGHRGNESVLTFASRLELDIYDFEQASLEHTLKLLKLGIHSITHAEMHNGNIQLSETGVTHPEQ